MWIYRHHSCSDVVDLDESSGRWQPVSDDDRPRVGALSMVNRANYPICGSYTVEDGRRYSMYWAEAKRFAFMTPDGAVIDICLKQPNGAIDLLVPGLRVEIAPASYADGRLRQGFQHVQIIDGQSRILHEVSYNAEYYERLYDNDFTVASGEQDLSDWDFFLALRDAVRYLSERAGSGRLG